MMATTPVLIDTDPGIDDAMAIAFATRLPLLDIVALTTVTGNASIAQTTHNAQSLRTRFAIEADVARGAGSALDGRTRPPPDFVHGADGLGNTDPPPGDRPLATLPAAETIIAAARRHESRLAIVALGQLTNLARALRLDPELPSRVARVVVMGGACGFGPVRGNVTPVAEANIHGDPLAADIVLNAGWPLTLVGLDVTMRTVMDTGRLHRLQAAGDLGAYLATIAAFYDRFYRQRHGMDGFPVHDSSAVAWLADPTLFETRRGRVRVITAGACRGHTLFVAEDVPRSDEAWSGGEVIDVCTSVDADRLLELYLGTIETGC